MSAHQSHSGTQLEAEQLIVAQVALHVGKPLAPRIVTFDSGAPVDVDGVDEDETVFVEIFVRQGSAARISHSSHCSPKPALEPASG